MKAKLNSILKKKRFKKKICGKYIFLKMFIIADLVPIISILNIISLSKMKLNRLVSILLGENPKKVLSRYSHLFANFFLYRNQDSPGSFGLFSSTNMW